MLTAAEAANAINMVGFNYIRTPASQYARKLLAENAIGDVTYFRAEMTEDFLADPDAPAQRGCANRPCNARRRGGDQRRSGAIYVGV